MVSNIEARVLTHGLDLADNLSDKAFVDKLVGKGRIDSYRDTVVRKGEISFLLFSFDKKIVDREFDLSVGEVKGETSFFVKLGFCFRTVKAGESVSDFTELFTVLRTDGFELRLEII